MKILKSTLVVFLLTFISMEVSNAQNNIIRIPGYYGGLWDLYFLDTNTGFIISEQGKIFKINNGERTGI